MSYKVYISSTYEDLKDLRAEAREAILKHELLPIGMEHYTSSEDRPVDKCLQDVRRCDIYVGIIAFRYGFMPEGFDGKSITHLEYEEAGRAGIPRLLFVISEDASWLPKWMDGDRSQINTFRNQVRNECMAPLLNDPKELKHEVYAALKGAVNRLHAVSSPPTKRMPVPVSDFEFPTLLPYLSDRSLQRGELELLLSEDSIKNLHRKPLVCIVHGHEYECHDEFLQKARAVILPELLALKKSHDSISSKRIDWPADTGSTGERLLLYRRNLVRKVTQLDGAGVDLIVQGLNTFSNPVLLYSETMTQAWGRGEEALINEWLDFWNALPDLVVGKILIVFLCVKHSAVTARPRWRRSMGDPSVKARKFLSKIDFKTRTGISGRVLSELSAVEYRDLSKWINDFVDQYCKNEDQMTEVRNELWKKLETFYTEEKSEKICMQDLVRKLKDLLAELKLKYQLGV